ncbi:hypothetical protein K0M31_005549 [Melipona bicolor]|uniref:Uncharacterized protein n=1 Tax=Melipona bicolor TaxID=60889 RepID=A0AA40KMZ0_9HYME|nr:hypothetical protein K0M31_005549 [Melipona bicolor]
MGKGWGQEERKGETACAVKVDYILLSQLATCCTLGPLAFPSVRSTRRKSESRARRRKKETSKRLMHFLKIPLRNGEPDGRILVSHSPREFQIPGLKGFNQMVFRSRISKDCTETE